MRRLVIGIVALLLASPLLSNGTRGNKQVFVSLSGSDRHAGTVHAPFRTVQRALLEAVNVAGPDTLVIHVRGGTYHLSVSIAVNGLKTPVRINNYQGEQVVFHGGQYLDGSRFEKASQKSVLARVPPVAREHLLEIDLRQQGVSDFGKLKQHGFGIIPEPAPLELFINGVPQTLARYPNGDGLLMIGAVHDEGSIPRNGDFTNRGAEFGFEYERPLQWRHAKDIWLHGKFSYGYNDDHLRIAAIDYEKRSFRMAQDHLYGVVTSTPRYIDSTKNRHVAGLTVRGYYAYNLLEEIDEPGEYYVDRETGRLYHYPHAEPTNAALEVSVLEDPLLSVKDAAGLHISGIRFTCSRGMGIYLENSSRITIDRCEFSNLGTVGISMGQKLQDNERVYHIDGSPKQEFIEARDFREVLISNCKVSNTGTGGIILSGGDRGTLQAGNNRIHNTEFHHTDRINHAYSPAVKIYGVGNQVSNCHFHDLRHQAIAFMGNDHVIEYSRFERVCTEADDMGAIYTGRDPASRGTEIRYNYLLDIQPRDAETSIAGIYIDDGSGGIGIRNNFFERVGNPGHYRNFAAVFYHGGHDNVLESNTFLDCRMAVGQSPWSDANWADFLRTGMMQHRLTVEVDIGSEIYQSRYPGLKDFFSRSGKRTNLIKGNLLVNTPLVQNGDFTLRDNCLVTNMLTTAVEADYGDVTRSFQKFEPFDFDKCGIIDHGN